jgi:HK97 gp10 family phage protein
MAEVRLNGVDQLGRALENLPKVIAKKYLRRAMVAGMTPIKVEAQARAPVLKVADDRRIAGALRDAIILFRDRNPGASGAAEKYYVTIRKIKLNRAQKKIVRLLNNNGRSITVMGDAFYGRFPEFGTAKMAPMPFMRPAFESQKENALNAFTASLRESLPNIVQDAKA